MDVTAVNNATAYWLHETLGNDSRTDMDLQILGFCWGSIGFSVILARDAASLGDWCPMFRNIIVASSSRVEMEKTVPCCFETSFTNHLLMHSHKTRRAHTSDMDFLLRHDVHTDFIKHPT